jgi:hypothetical protein
MAEPTDMLKKVIEDLSDVDVEEGKMHRLLDVPEDEAISDKYDSGEQLARDLVDATGDEAEASSMIAYAANINPEDNIFDDALDAIGRIDFEEQINKRQNMKLSKREVRKIVRESIREVMTEETAYQEFFKSQMDMLGIDSPQDLTDKGKRKFFDFLGLKWDEDSDQADPDVEDDVTDVISSDEIKEERKLRSVIRGMLNEINAEMEYEMTLANADISFIGPDRMGNKRVMIQPYSGSAFSIQTNQNLPTLHRLGQDFFTAPSSEQLEAEKEIVDYVEQFGTPRQQRIL